MSEAYLRTKKLEWKRFYVCAVVAEDLAVPARDWLWQRHAPQPGRRMQLTNCSLSPGAEDGITEMHLLMEYAARGTNSTDVRRKVWEALTKVGGTKNVLARVEAKTLATVWLDFDDYRHNDKQWLDDRVFAAQEVAVEVAARFDPTLLEPEDEDSDWLKETG